MIGVPVSLLLVLAGVFGCALRVQGAQLLPVTSAIPMNVREEFAYPQALPVPININGVPYSNIYINEDGAFSFEQTFITVAGENRYRKGVTWVAPFGADVDGTGGGNMYFQTLSVSPESTAYITSLVNQWNTLETFIPTSAFVVTWENVTQYNGDPTLKNTFQAVLTSDGTKTFAVFLYGEINWWPATVGISVGGSSNFVTVCYSDTAETRLLPRKSRSLCGTPGTLVVRVETTADQCFPVYTPIDCTNLGTGLQRDLRCGVR